MVLICTYRTGVAEVSCDNILLSIRTPLARRELRIALYTSKQLIATYLSYFKRRL